MVVECMRNGMTPLDACKEVVERITNLHETDQNGNILSWLYCLKQIWRLRWI